MDQRKRILTIAFAALLGLWVGSKTLYSWWIKPLLTIEEDIAALEVKRDEAAEFDNGYKRAQWDYEQLVSRVGTTQIGALKGVLHRRIEKLAHDHGLTDLKVAPKLQQRYGKTECTLLGFTVSGQQKLAEVLRFMEDLYELPHVMRLVDPRLQPITPPRDKKPEDLVKISLEVQALLLPPRPRPKLDYVVDKKSIPPQPAEHVRHEELDLLALGDLKPFLEYEPPKIVKTHEPPPEESHKPKDEPALMCKPWKGSWKLAVISLMHAPQAYRVLAQDGSKTSSQKYIAPGEEFDGGLLDSVTTLAVLVRYHDGNYVYPLGSDFKNRIKAEEADRYPALKERAATLPPLTQDEIRALPGKAGKTVTASTASSSSSKPGGNSKNSPTLHRTPTTGTAGPPSRASTPGRLSSPVRSGSAADASPSAGSPRPTGSTGTAGSPRPPGNGDGANEPTPPVDNPEELPAPAEDPMPAPDPPPSPPGPPDN